MNDVNAPYGAKDARQAGDVAGSALPGSGAVQLTDAELCDALADAIKRCCERMGGKMDVPFFSIPADPKRDIDLLMAAARERILRGSANIPSGVKQ